LPLLRHCYTFQLFADPLRCRDTPRHSFAIPSTTVLCLASATHCLTQPCRCFSGRIEATRSDAQPSRVTVSQYLAISLLRNTELGAAFPCLCLA
jgi:hypothetical protein